MLSRLARSFLALWVAGCGGSILPNGDGGAPAFDAPLGDLGALPCGAGSCKPGQVCEFGDCVKDCSGSGGLRCGGPDMCCQKGEVCYLGKCTVPGMPCVATTPDGGAGGCGAPLCPKGQHCEPSLGKCLPDVPMTSNCEYHPPVGKFAPVVKWEWQGSKTLPDYDQVMMTPVVADLDGNCMPDVVFATFCRGGTGASCKPGDYQHDGVLRAVRGDGKGELWTVTDPKLRVVPGSQVALADVDGDGKVVVFACHESGKLIAFHHDGTLFWTSSGAPCLAYDAPLLADVDHDGTPEAIVSYSVFNALTGALKNTPPAPHGYYTTAAELDGNPQNGMELVGGNLAYHWDGSLYWDKSGGNQAFSAVADLDGDGLPDTVAVVPGTHGVSAYRHDGTLLWGPVDVNNGVPTPQGPSGGGPPTVADFDGDGKPDVAAAGGYGYLVIKGQTGKVLWQDTSTQDYSSRVTGSSVFDFEGDGPAEAIYNDELALRVYEGATGKLRFKLCSTSGTLYENPVIVDVDGDDHAEIVVMNNNYAFPMCGKDTGGGPSHTGFKVIGDAENRWVRTRRIWNQHAYHVTNIGDDGRVPKVEPDNWTQPGLNNFRQNVQTKNLFAAPDLVPANLRTEHDLCAKNQIHLFVTVLNQGAAGAPAGIPVTFYLVGMAGPMPIGTVKTIAPLLPGSSETVSLAWSPPDGKIKGPYTVYAVVNDDGTGKGIVNECNRDNNQSMPAQVGCPLIG